MPFITMILVSLLKSILFFLVGLKQKKELGLKPNSLTTNYKTRELFNYITANLNYMALLIMECLFYNLSFL